MLAMGQTGGRPASSQADGLDTTHADSAVARTERSGLLANEHTIQTWMHANKPCHLWGGEWQPKWKWVGTDYLKLARLRQRLVRVSDWTTAAMGARRMGNARASWLAWLAGCPPACSTGSRASRDLPTADGTVSRALNESVAFA